MIIPGFSNYSYIDGKFYNNKSGKELAVTTSKSSSGKVKLKSDDGEWKSVSVSTILASIYPPQIPSGFVEIPKFHGYYISKTGEVWAAPNHQYPSGKYLSVCLTGRYPKVSLASGTVELHQLLARAFIMSDYVERGLCVLHLDDDKKNFNLSNLRVGTYSENNSAAYATGANPGKL